MDIYEALDKLKQNKRIDRTARRKQLVEKKLAESDSKKPVKKLNESRMAGKKLNERIGSRYSAENVDELIQHYIESWILDAKVYCDDIRDYLESEALDPDYILDSADDGRVYQILDNTVDMLCDYYAENSYKG